MRSMRVTSPKIRRRASSDRKLCLETAGTSLQNVMKCNIYCTSAKHFATVNAIYARYFPENPPARIFRSETVPADRGHQPAERDEVQHLLHFRKTLRDRQCDLCALLPRKSAGAHLQIGNCACRPRAPACRT